MKPTKCRKVCPACGRPKMLFETEKKALTFIKFNGDEVERLGEQLRVYYCDACCGWHITSHPYKKSYDNLTDKLLDAYKISQKAKNMFRHKIKTCLLIIRRLIK